MQNAFAFRLIPETSIPSRVCVAKCKLKTEQGRKLLFVSLLAVFLAACASDPPEHVVSTIHEAAQRGDLAGVKRAVEQLMADPANINVRDSLDDTALLGIVEFADKLGSKSALDLVNTLLAHGADVNARNGHGYTAVMYASEKGALDMVSTLLAHGANANDALFVASGSGNPGLVNTLLASGANANAHRTRTIVVYDGFTQSTDETALTVAANKGSVDVVNALLARGAKPDNSALAAAAGKGNLVMVNALLAHGADVNAQSSIIITDSDGYGHIDYSTALHNAARKGSLDVVNTLLAHGADVNEKDAGAFSGFTPLMGAVLGGSLDVVKSLLEHGTDINAKSRGGGTALIFAAGNSNQDIVNALLARGADVNYVNLEISDSGTALMSAAARGNLEVVKTLIAHGANANAQAKNGDTALGQAKTDDVREFLKTNGAKLSSVEIAKAADGQRQHYASHQATGAVPSTPKTYDQTVCNSVPSNAPSGYAKEVNYLHHCY